MKRNLFVICVLIFMLCVTGCSGAKKNDGTVRLYVHCETVLDNGAVAEDYPGIPLIFDDDVEVAAGNTAYDVISAALRDEKIQFEFEDSAYGKYLNGVANIYSGDFGETSGWIFKVNGEFAEVSCSEYEVKNGDVIEIVYTCVMGDID